MPIVIRFAAALMLVALCCSATAAQQPSQGATQEQPTSPKQQSEFIPIDQLPPTEQMPAAPLLIAAYSVALIALTGYLMSVARRLGAVQREVDRLERDVRKSGRT